jgi:GNAT superfamily N-acetyltransferase
MLKVDLIEAKASDFINRDLRSEAEDQAGEEVIVLRALSCGSEVALVILSLPVGLPEAELEKLYVPKALRKGGIASSALQSAEKHCSQRGFAVLTLWANPLDDDTDQEWLIDWYKRRGYVDADGGYAELKKTL